MQVRPTQRSLTITNRTDQLQVVRDFVRESLHAGAVNSGIENRISLAIDEAVANIIEHGYESDRTGSIDLLIEISPGRFQVVIRDSGHSFHPDGVADPDLDEHLREGKRSGLGVFLMRQVMDEVEYSFREGLRNELKMVKYL
ncbi:MAG: ATP-binding protein [Planctomycetes bacterium]|nr:ATP-binding protein [Planctomycetota bacterium]